MTEFVYTIKSHPTSYKGVNFRSRLEATWAAFFDLCGWEWEYEPFDLDGWTPDFLIKGDAPTLVEVKPVDFSASKAEWWGLDLEPLAMKYASKVYDHMKALPSDVPNGEVPQIEYELAVVGLGPFIDDGCFAPWCMGAWVLDSWCMGTHPISLCYGDKSKVDYMSCSGGFYYRYSGTYDGDNHLEVIDGNIDLPMELWKQAKNLTQWKPA